MFTLLVVEMVIGGCATCLCKECSGITICSISLGNLGRYEMTRATKMTLVNVSYELQLCRSLCHSEPETVTVVRWLQDVSGCCRMFRHVSGWEVGATME